QLVFDDEAFSAGDVAGEDVYRFDVSGVGLAPYDQLSLSTLTSESGSLPDGFALISANLELALLA
ncbi:MAG: hypothetical protein AAGG02_10505, partial [Cyanobacteria bacterium P01_H01_bin.15]